jgi:hypothetical protein
MRNDGVADVIDVVIAYGPAFRRRSARYGIEVIVGGRPSV